MYQGGGPGGHKNRVEGEEDIQQKKELKRSQEEDKCTGLSKLEEGIWRLGGRRE